MKKALKKLALKFFLEKMYSRKHSLNPVTMGIPLFFKKLYFLGVNYSPDWTDGTTVAGCWAVFEVYAIADPCGSEYDWTFYEKRNTRKTKKKIQMMKKCKTFTDSFKL